MKKKLLTALDVGTTKVCTIVADITDPGTLKVIGVGICPSKGLHKGMVVNINEAREAIQTSLNKAEQACNHKIETAYVGVTGRHVTSLNNRGVVSINRNDRLVRPEDLRRVLTTAESVDVPNDRRLLHIIPRNYAVDGQVGVKNPVGMHGFRLDVETHVITASVTSVQNLVKCVRSVGIDIEDLVLEPLASAEAVLTPDEKQVGVILADIGGGTTDIAVFRDGSIWHSAVVPVAGYQLTRDIALGLGVPFDVAEEMKKKYGSVIPVYEGKSKENEAISHDSHGASYQDLSDILKARVEEILKLMVLEMPNTNWESMVPGGLVLTGGSANISGLAVLAHDILRVPVHIGVPTANLSGVTDKIKDPAYATAVGLLLWGSNHMPTQNWQTNDVGQTFKRIGFQIKKMFQ